MALTDVLLPHLDARAIEAAYRAAPGNELDSGKFASLESSAALVANAFGAFLGRPDLLPTMPGVAAAWPPLSVELEGVARFPWAGGRHPCLDVLIGCADALVGVESKRYEPYLTNKTPALSNAYWRPVWGERMRGVERVRDGLRGRLPAFRHLDATQLVKHAFGLRSAAARSGRAATLVYLHREPRSWPDGRPIPDDEHALHRTEVERFAEMVAEDEVMFVHLTWSELLTSWAACENDEVRRHAAAVVGTYGP